MRRIVAIDHEGDSIPLDYESLADAHRAIYSGEWLLVRGEGPLVGRAGYLNPAAVYALAETDE